MHDPYMYQPLRRFPYNFTWGALMVPVWSCMIKPDSVPFIVQLTEVTSYKNKNVHL